MVNRLLIGCALAAVLWPITAFAVDADANARIKIVTQPRLMKLLLDGQVVREALRIDNVTLSPDGKRLAYSYARLVKINGVEKAEHLLVVDDDEHGPFEQVGDMTFSRDSAHLAARVYTQPSPRDPRLQCIFLNGQVIASDVGANLLGFDAANRFYYRTYGKVSNSTAVRVIELSKADRGEPRTLDDAGWVHISSDGKHVAIHEVHTVSQTRVTSRFVVDGKALPTFGAIEGSDAMFSPDGRRVAYIAWNDATTNLAVVDGEVIARCKGFHKTPTWSADGSAVAFIGYPTGRGTDNRQQLFINSESVGEASGFDVVRFSPDGKHWAAVARDRSFSGKHTFRALCDGREIGPYERIDARSFEINSDGQLVFEARQNGKAVTYRGE